MDNSWVFDLETKLLSMIKVKTESTLKKKYPDIFYTNTDSPKDVSTHFPTVYVHELPGVEKAKTTEGNSIESVFYSLQVEVTSQKSQKETKYVLSRIAEVLKDSGFSISSFPEASNGKTYYRSIMRASRLIGRTETL